MCWTYSWCHEVYICVNLISISGYYVVYCYSFADSFINTMLFELLTKLTLFAHEVRIGLDLFITIDCPNQAMRSVGNSNCQNNRFLEYRTDSRTQYICKWTVYFVNEIFYDSSQRRQPTTDFQTNFPHDLNRMQIMSNALKQFSVTKWGTDTLSSTPGMSGFHDRTCHIIHRMNFLFHSARFATNAAILLYSHLFSVTTLCISRRD